MAKRPEKKIFIIRQQFIGVAMITLLYQLISYFLCYSCPPQRRQLVAAVSSGMMFGLGIAIWAFYFRRQPGTSLWKLPRNFAEYLNAPKNQKFIENLAQNSSVIAEAYLLSRQLSPPARLLSPCKPLLAIISVAINVVNHAAIICRYHLDRQRTQHL